jgi:predicted secreted protein with PEFG-CTERM motif
MKTHLSVFTIFAIIAIIGIAPAFGQVANPVTVTTDKTAYVDGETVLVTGEVREFLSGFPISLSLIAPNGNLVTVEQIDIGSDNKYSAELTLGGPLMTMGGTYTIEVQYGTTTRTAQTTFEFPGSVISDKGTPVTIEGTEDKVYYKIVGGKVISIAPDLTPEQPISLIVEIEATQDGSLTITLPRSVIKSEEDGKDSPFFVLVDNEEVEFEEIGNTPTDRTLFIEFQEGAEQIEIIGTWAIPEFGTIAVMILAVAIISIIAISARSRLSIMPRY